jgi:ribose transport system substrate-binding protein
MKFTLKSTLIASTAMIFATGGAFAQSGTLKIGITQNNVGVDSYQTTYEKAFIEAADANDKVEAVVLDAGGDVARQIAQIEDLIQQKVDAIIIWPTNGEAVIPAVRKASKAGVLQISGQPGYTTAIERQQGFDDRLPEVCPNVTLVETQPGDWNREKAQKVMEAFLVKYDDIDGVYSGDDNMGVGALNAAKAAGRDGIIFVGATNFAVGYEAMGRGEYWGSIYQSPVDDAKAALKTAVDILEGKELPFLNYFDTPKITQDNMGQFVKPVF